MFAKQMFILYGIPIVAMGSIFVFPLLAMSVAASRDAATFTEMAQEWCASRAIAYAWIAVTIAAITTLGLLFAWFLALDPKSRWPSVLSICLGLIIFVPFLFLARSGAYETRWIFGFGAAVYALALLSALVGSISVKP